MEKTLQSNVLVLREDIINTWKWTEEIKNELEKIKERQERMEKIIERLLTMVNIPQKEEIRYTFKITEVTEV